MHISSSCKVFLTIVFLDVGKAHYGRVSTHVILREDDEAEKDLKAALAVVPSDQNVADTLSELRQRKKFQREREKKVYQSLFT